MRCLFILILSASFSLQTFANPISITPQNTWEGWVPNILVKKAKKRIKEPSGIVFHPQRKTLFVVSDEGLLAEISLSGKLKNRKNLSGSDLEGIAVNPKTGLLYLAVEGNEVILEVDPKRLRIQDRFQIERRLEKQIIFPIGGNGIESIAFVPNENHPEGGTFFVANQVENQKSKEKSFIAEIEVPLKSRKNHRAKIIQAWPTTIFDISGMQFIPERQTLAVISDVQNLYLEIDLLGRIKKEMSLPGWDQEGITFGLNGKWYIAQDSNGEDDAIVKYSKPLFDQ